MHQIAPASSSDPLAGTDKIVVDRRAPHRLSGSRTALAAAREALSSDETQPTRCRDELLLLFAEASRTGRLALLALPVVALGALLPFLGVFGYAAAGAWLSLALGVWALRQHRAAACRRVAQGGGSLAPFTRAFALVQAAQGLVWGLFFTLTHAFFLAEGAAGLPSPVLLGVLLVVGCAHVLLSHAVPGGVAAVVAPAFVFLLGVLGPLAWSGDMAATTTLAGAAVMVLTFWMLGAQMLQQALATVRARMEADRALLEAEEAQNLSEEARRRAEEANMAKTRFLATMSHELRTPLNAILGFSEIMEQEAMGPLGNPKYKEYVGDIHTSGTHLLKLINEILDLSRVEAGRYELHEEAIDLAGVAGDALQMVKLKAAAKDIHVALRTEPALPNVWADERAVRQVVLNLLSNAVKFTPKGGAITVKVGWTGSGGQYVTVADNGPGIPAEEIPLVMSSFGQGSIALKVAEPGSGLGLPICAAFMKMHDGRLDLQSKLREGTQVIAVFPRRRVLADALPEASPAAQRAFA